VRKVEIRIPAAVEWMWMWMIPRERWFAEMAAACGLDGWAGLDVDCSGELLRDRRNPSSEKERGGERNPPSVPWEAACNLLHQRLSGLRGRRRL